MSPETEAFFDPDTNTVTYVVWDRAGGACAVIDPVLDYAPNSGKISTRSADQVISFIRSKDVILEWILETHVHADHLTAAPYLKQTLGGRIAIGQRVGEVQQIFGNEFNAGPDFIPDGRQFDHLFTEDEHFKIGELTGQVIMTPGHTPACVTYVFEGMAFVGDTLFMPDYGTARCDFPGGSSQVLYRSIRKILALPDETRLMTGHDYPPGGRDAAWESSVWEQKAHNIHLQGDMTEQDFSALRDSRDAGLEMPRLILPAVQVNMRAGHFPPKEDNGRTYLKIPVSNLP